MSNSKLEQDLIRLGSQNPELQKHLEPILDNVTKTASSRVDKVKRSLRKALTPYVDTIDDAYANTQAGEAIVSGLAEDRPLDERDLEQGLSRVMEPYVNLNAEVVYDDFIDKYSVRVTATF